MICCCNDCRAGAGWVHSRPPRCRHPDAAIWRRFIRRSRSCGFYLPDFSGSWSRVPPPPRTSPCACRWPARSAGPASSSITSTAIRRPPRRITNAVRSPMRVMTAPISAFPRWRRRRPGWRCWRAADGKVLRVRDGVEDVSVAGRDRASVDNRECGNGAGGRSRKRLGRPSIATWPRAASRSGPATTSRPAIRSGGSACRD